MLFPNTGSCLKRQLPVFGWAKEDAVFQTEQTTLILIDLQEKLAERMCDRDQLVKNIRTLIQGIKVLGIPVVWTEQVSAKLGNTIPEIIPLLGELKPIEKESFSCCPNKRFMEVLTLLNRKQILVAGIETHVCVYQTAADLIRLKYEVQVVVDAVSSRTRESKEIRLGRIRESGGGLTSVETILCELLKTAEDDRFKAILKLIK